MLVSHRNDLTVLSRDHEQVCDALDEGSALGAGRPRAILGQREDRDGLPGGGEDVYALMAVLKRQVDQRMPGDAAPARKIQPNRPFGITRTWRALWTVGDAMGAAAAVATAVREAMQRIIRRSLLRTRPRILCVRLRLLPPAELREIQRVELFEKAGLDLSRPGFKAFGEVGGVQGDLPVRSGRAVSAVVFRLTHVIGAVMVAGVTVERQMTPGADTGHQAASRTTRRRAGPLVA